MRRILSVCFILAMIVAMLSACATPASESTATTTAASAGTTVSTTQNKQLVFSLITMDSVNEYWLAMKAEAEKKADELGIEIRFDSPVGTTDAQAQYNSVDNAISNGVDAILLAAVDKEALAAAVDKAAAAKIPVIYVDAPASSKNYLASFATDNAQAGAIAADELAKLMQGKGEVAIVNAQQGVATCQQREQGFKAQVAAKYPNISIVDTLYSEGDAQKAMDQTNNLLAAHPQITGIFAANESCTVGVSQGLTQSNMAGKIFCVGFDPSDRVKELIKNGSVNCAMQQNPGRMGADGVQTAYDYIISGKTPDPKDVDTGVTVVSKDNL